MDRREAIEILKEYRRYALREAITEALGLAIEALSEPITIRKVVLEPTNPETLWEQGMRSYDGLEAELFVKEKHQLSGETSTKLKNPDDSLLTEDSEACKEQKSKLDCISRQQAIEALDRIGSVDTEADREYARDIFDNLPLVTPTERTGEWVEREDWNGDNYYDCSACGESFVLIDGTPSMNLYHYCPNCGAKMGGGTENE